MDLNYFNDAIIVVYQYVGLFPTKSQKKQWLNMQYMFYDAYIH